jgi:hypothetical protein
MSRQCMELIWQHSTPYAKGLQSSTANSAYYRHMNKPQLGSRLGVCEQRGCLYASVCFQMLSVMPVFYPRGMHKQVRHGL